MPEAASEDSVERLLVRLRTLEDQVQSLRFSRRVLMDLLVAMDHDRRERGARLKEENERLRRMCRQMARLIQVGGALPPPPIEGEESATPVVLDRSPSEVREAGPRTT
ncbi:MAG TPA: hypothetical protein VGL40_11145 [Bacillota bacterium]